MRNGAEVGVGVVENYRKLDDGDLYGHRVRRLVLEKHPPRIED